MTTPRGISEKGPSLRVLLVEDEALLLMMTADMVDELGHQVVAKAGSIEQAMIVLQVADFDHAVLDVNVAGQPITSIAAIIADRGLPFVLATGYGAGALPEEFRDRPHLRKPFLLSQLRAAIDAAIKI
jgi:CheY-like chemotaxis protein